MIEKILAFILAYTMIIGKFTLGIFALLALLIIALYLLHILGRITSEAERDENEDNHL